MKLYAHVPGAEPWKIGEFPGVTLEEAFAEAAEQTASDAGSDLLEGPEQHFRDILRDHMIEDMTRALHEPGDKYRAPDGVLYTLDADKEEL